MTLLLLGLALWVLAHFFKRLMPAARSGLENVVGQGPAKGILAFVMVVGIVLMVLGFGRAEYVSIYTPIPGIGHLNNLLMLVAIMLLGAGSSKGKMRSWLRHPMLWGVVVWAVAHLLVNGDKASIVLFGGMALWALVQMVLVNRAIPDWERPKAGPLKGDIRLLIISIVLYAVIAAIHTYIGYNLFAGTYA